MGTGSFHVNAHASQFSQLSREFVSSGCTSRTKKSDERGGEGDGGGRRNGVRLMCPHAFFKVSPAILSVWASLLRLKGSGGVGGAKGAHGGGRGTGGVALHVFRKQYYRVAVRHMVAFFSRAFSALERANGVHIHICMYIYMYMYINV